MDLERRLQSGFREDPNDAPGIVIGDDNVVRVVGTDGSRFAIGDVSAIPPSGPITLSAPFAGGAGDQTFIPLVAPYEGHVTGAFYLLSDAIAFAGDEERTWTLETIDGLVLFSLTLNESTGGADAGTTLILNLEDLDGGAQTIDKQPLRWRSASDTGPDDPGGVVIVSFVDPLPIEVATLSPDVDFVTDFEGRRPGDVPKPTITSFSPDRGVPGTEVKIVGKNFTGAQAIHFGSFGANGTIMSDTLIIAKVPEENVTPGSQLPVYIEIVGADGQVGVSPNQFYVLTSNAGGGGGGDVFGVALSGIGLAIGPETGGLSVLGVTAIKATFLVAVTAFSVETTVTHGGIVYDYRLDGEQPGPNKVFASSTWNGARPVPAFPGKAAQPWGYNHKLRWTYRGQKYTQVFKGTVGVAAAMVAAEAVADYARQDASCFQFYVVSPRLVKGRVVAQAVLKARSGCAIINASFRIQIRWGVPPGTLVADSDCSFGAGSEHVAEASVAANAYYGLPAAAQWIARGTGLATIRDKKGVVSTVSLETPSRFIPGDVSLFKNQSANQPVGAGSGSCA